MHYLLATLTHSLSINNFDNTLPGAYRALSILLHITTMPA